MLPSLLKAAAHIASPAPTMSMLLSCLRYSAAVNNIHSNYQGKPQTYHMAYAGKQHLIAICSKLQGQLDLGVGLSIKQQAQKNRKSLCGWESNDIRSTEIVRVLIVLEDANASMHKRLP